MTIVHHPSDDLLLRYATGASDEADGLLIATHLALCPICRRMVAQAEATGGTLLEDADAIPMSGGALHSVMARLDGPYAAAKAPALPSAVSAPEPLRSYIGGDLDFIGWTNIAAGISFKPLFRSNGKRVQLIRSRAGNGVGLHSHNGEEFTLCLAGGYTDNTGSYARGDFQFATPENLHRPIADAGKEDCIVLAMSAGSLRFSNPLVGLIGKWFGF
jgi:putative transcriptional regulator